MFNFLHVISYFLGMYDMLTKFQKMQISKGHLLTVKGDVQMIKDAFFKGKLISEICKNYEKLRERCFSSCYVRGTKKKF